MIKECTREHTGAGISISSGIPDFRRPKGVRTLEKLGKKPSVKVSFDTARPTYTHKAINKLVQLNYVNFVVNRNNDRLHLKAGTSTEVIADMHGNVFIEQCHKCRRKFIRETSVPTVGLEFTGNKYPFSAEIRKSYDVLVKLKTRFWMGKTNYQTKS